MPEPISPRPRGLWGSVTSGRRSYAALAQALVDELDAGLALLETLPPAITIFGGARITPDDPFFDAGRRIGAALARAGIPPRTGAGPGIMAAVPEGYRQAHPQVPDVPTEGRKSGAVKLEDTAPHVSPQSLAQGGTPHVGPQALTQGFNIRLPFEQKQNPDIEVGYELVHFPTRKLLLWEASLGTVVFPGGFGTLDELFEVWRLRAAGRLGDPIVLFGSAFWDPLLDALRHAWLHAKSPLASPDLFSLVRVLDDPDEVVRTIASANAKGWDEDPRKLGVRMARDLEGGLAYLERLPTAVAVLGGTRLAESHPAVRFAEELAFELGRSDVPTRASGPGPFALALTRGSRRADPCLPVQAFDTRRFDVEVLHPGDRVHVVADRTTHKVLLTEGTRAVVALPGGLGTLDELFSILCQLQTGMIAKRPVLLVGRGYWTPLFAAIRAVMLDGPRRTIAAEDLDLVRIVDDPREAAAACVAGPR